MGLREQCAVKVVLRPQPVPRAAPRAASPAWGYSDRTRLGDAQRPGLGHVHRQWLRDIDRADGLGHVDRCRIDRRHRHCRHGTPVVRALCMRSRGGQSRLTVVPAHSVLDVQLRDDALSRAWSRQRAASPRCRRGAMAGSELTALLAPSFWGSL
jgi:hypothetical protein